MPKKAGMETWKKRRKIEYLEIKKERYYIFCEGEQTEPLYFSGFKRMIEKNPIYKDMVLVEIEPCGAETMRVMDHAEEYVRKNKIKKGQIWCVYDKDSYPAKDFNGVEEKARHLNKQGKQLTYHVAWSNECIEYWFVLHFANYTSNNSRIEYIRFLENTFKEMGIEKYQKNMPDIFDILMQYGNPKLACKYAKRIIQEGQGKTPTDIAPGTTIYELVEELAKYLPEGIQEKYI